MKKRTKNIIAATLFLFATTRMFASSKSSKFFITENNILRPCDGFGCGTFKAGRGEKLHQGIDIVVYENEPIKAPFNCKITRYGYPYADDGRFRLLELQGLDSFSNYTAKIMYIKPLKHQNLTFKKGEIICHADDISKKFNSTMTPHVHFELYKNGQLIDPTKYF